MKSHINSVYEVVCWVWLAVLILGLNVTMSFISPVLLFFAVILFCLIDMVLSRHSILVKILVSLLLIHRTFYVGSFFSRSWLGWLWADLGKDLSVIFQQGWLSPSPILGMVLTLLFLIVLQSLYFSFIARRKGALLLLFAGTSLLTGASLWYGQQATVWYVVLYVIIGLVIMGTTRVQTRLTFPMQRWLSILLIWVLCITSIAWALPSGNLYLGGWYEKAQAAWERLLAERGNDSVGPLVRRVGYGSYDSELGGPLENDYTHIMTVTSPRPVYLVGEARSSYTGRGWLPKSYELKLTSFIEYIQPPPKNIDGQEVEISIEIVVTHGSTLFAPRYVNDFSFGGNNRIMIMHAIDYEFQSANPLRAGDTFTMNVLLPLDDPDELRQASSLTQDQRYLQLPSGIHPRVLELALDITSEADNGYDKAMALVNYLRSGKWRYSLEAERTPPGQDFVDWFLFEQDRGYCAHFSTAFVIMARAAGLPARWVKGFSSGVSDGQGRYRITNSNSHSWAEVWFDEYGWVPFEPTPGSTLNTISTPDPNRPDVPVAPIDPENPIPDPGQRDLTPQDPEQPLGVQGYPVAIILILVLAAGLGLFMRGASRRTNSLAVAYTKLQTRLRLFGWHRYWWETPREHLNRIAMLPDQPALAEFVQHFEESVYGGTEIGDHSLELRNLGKRFSVIRLAMYHLFSRR